MNIEFMCGLLANYSKELSESETYREKGNVQLKHAILIIDKVKNCSIPAVMQQSEQLIDFFKWLNTYEELKYTEKGISFYVEEYLKSINCA